MAGFNFNIPDDVHIEFKSNCALDGVDMSDKLVELIKSYNKKRLIKTIKKGESNASEKD